MSGEITFKGVTFQPHPQSESQPRPDDRDPFRILIMGDFGAPTIPFGERRPRRIDRDDLEEVLSSLQVELRIPIGPDPTLRVPLPIRELDDFHPDQFAQRIPVPATSPSPSPPQTTPQQRPSEAIPDEGGPLLERVLEQTQEKYPASSNGDDLQEMLEELVAPHRAPVESEAERQSKRSRKEALADCVRDILHHPDFQRVEAAWRSLDLLVRSVETSSKLQLCILPMTREELLRSLDEDDASDLSRLLAEEARTNGAFSLLVGLYAFGSSQDDAQSLSSLGRLAAQTGAPWIFEGNPALVGCESLHLTPDRRDWKDDSLASSEAWQSLRRSEVAPFLGLALPRILLRLPYGKDTDPCERVSLEEMPEGSVHQHYLWGSPSVLAALLLAQSFAKHGWKLRSGMHHELEGRPMHAYDSEHIKCCSEVPLDESTAQHFLENGIMPVVWIRNTDTIRWIRFQSIADPLTGLAGRWE